MIGLNYTERIRNLRKENNMTLRDVADSIGLTEEKYAGYEEDANNLPNLCLIKLSHLYNVSVDYMLCLTDKPERLP